MLSNFLIPSVQYIFSSKQDFWGIRFLFVWNVRGHKKSWEETFNLAASTKTNSQITHREEFRLRYSGHFDGATIDLLDKIPVSWYIWERFVRHPFVWCSLFCSRVELFSCKAWEDSERAFETPSILVLRQGCLYSVYIDLPSSTNKKTEYKTPLY